MRHLVAVLALVVSAVGLNAGNVNEEQFRQIFNDCVNNKSKFSCQKLIDMNAYPKGKCDRGTCRAIGLVYEFAGHYQEAMKYFQKATELGDAMGYANLGFLYMEGRGVKQNYSEALKFYKKACDSNIASVCDELGDLYYAGKNIKQDFVIAKHYYEKACNADYASSCVSLSMLYLRGEGVKKDSSLGIFFIEKACILGDKVSCETYELFNGYKEKRNKLADDCLTNKNKDACQKLIKSGKLRDTKDCDKTNCYDIAFIYYFADNHQQAFQYFYKACELNDERGCYDVGMSYIKGWGVRQNKSMAKKYFNKACNLGNQKSCDSYKMAQ